jgi:hypothetical protein
MKPKALEVSAIALDETGRVILSDEHLLSIESELHLAGGQSWGDDGFGSSNPSACNSGCNNPTNCNDTTNYCTNSLACGRSTNIDESCANPTSCNNSSNATCSNGSRPNCGSNDFSCKYGP